MASGCFEGLSDLDAARVTKVRNKNHETMMMCEFRAGSQPVVHDRTRAITGLSKKLRVHAVRLYNDNTAHLVTRDRVPHSHRTRPADLGTYVVRDRIG